MISPYKENITQSCKLDFEVTNNVAEYEAFILGLQLAKSLKENIRSCKANNDRIIESKERFSREWEKKLEINEMILQILLYL